MKDTAQVSFGDNISAPYNKYPPENRREALKAVNIFKFWIRNESLQLSPETPLQALGVSNIK